MARKKLYINNTDISTYGIYITSDTVLDAPSFDYVEHQVPGRDGTLLQYNNRLNNVIRKFACCIPSRLLVSSGIASLKKLLYANPGYVKIVSDYESGVYQYGYLAQDINVKPFNVYRMCTFDLYFSCQPKKYFNSASQTVNGTYFANVKATITRSSGFLKKMLDDIPLSIMPNDTAFFVISNYSNIASSTSITNISCSWSEGDTFCAVCDALSGSTFGENAYKGMIAYANDSISSASYTSTGHCLVFIVPVRTTGTYTCSYTINGTTTTITTPTLSSATASVTNASATGVSLKVDVGYDFVTSQTVFMPNAMTLVYYGNNVKLGDCVIVWRTDLASPELLQTLTNYAVYYDGSYSTIFTVDLTNNRTVASYSGMPDLNLDGVMEITGSIPSVGVDKVEAIVFKGATLTGGKLYADWWAL